MKEKYIPPILNAPAFNCPNCRAFSHQKWYFLHAASRRDGYGDICSSEDFKVSECVACEAITIWHGSEIIFPATSVAPLASPDLPDDIRPDFDEAREIVGRSPRGAAALLRLAIQKLCKHLGQSGHNINDDIGCLVKQGLPVGVQQALDIVRVVGNNAVHPGIIDLQDDPKTALALFKLINIIVEKMITEPREIAALYAALPQGAKDGIKKRDGGP